MSEQEEWRPIPGFPHYFVSSLGRALSTKRGRRIILRASPNKDGYPQIKAWQDGVPTDFAVHRLVARLFIGPRPEGQEVRHLDGVKTNCAVGNLRYGTRSENTQDRRRHGTDHNVNKTHCPRNHPYDEANTYYAPTGRRCRECARISLRASRARRQFAAANIQLSTGENAA
jgi:hypothetical protein